MRKLFLFCMLAWIPACGNPLWGDAPRVGVADPKNGQQRTGTGNTQSSTNQIGTQARPPIVDTEGHIQTPPEAADAKKKADRASDVERRTLDAVEGGTKYAKWTAIATWVLVGVGLLAAGAAVITLRSINRQVNLMAVPYRQSVIFKDWESEVYESLPERTPALRIGFSLTSAIDFPLTIHYGEIIFMPRTNPTPYVIQETFLPPGTPHSGNVYLALNDHTRLVLKHGPVLFSFEGHFIHTGPLGLKERMKQRFEGDVVCREGHETTCEFRLHSNQKHKGEQQRPRERRN